MKQVFEQSVLVIKLHAQLIQLVEDQKDIQEIWKELLEQEAILNKLKMEVKLST